MSHVPLQTRKPIATVATPMLDFTGLGILQEAHLSHLIASITHLN
ncbi:hypothetical protein AAKU61_003131 [Undibacterium sp. GrIS 1.2]